MQLHLGKAARIWYSQLPYDTKTEWISLSESFLRTFGRHSHSDKKMYYQMEQGEDETLVEYLHRLNAAAGDVGIDYRNWLPSMREHVSHFLGSIKDYRAADHLRMSVFNSMTQFEDLVMMWEDTHSKSKRPALAKHDFNRRVNVMNQNSQAERYEGVCDHCKKSGHSSERCYQKMTCYGCGNKGHSIANCLENARKIIERFKKGEPSRRPWTNSKKSEQESYVQDENVQQNEMLN